MSLFAMTVHTLSERPDIQLQGHLHHRNSRIAAARNLLAEAALEGQADWILWLDADQTFPPDTLLKLLAHDQPFVGCNYRKKIPDREISATGIEPKEGGVDPVDWLGFGVTLTAARIFRSLDQPWFQDGPRGEDGFFCERAKAAGFQPHVDHSLKVGHISEVELRFET
jgi:glycosyltransferase involved in cell wall biosynthesis